MSSSAVLPTGSKPIRMNFKSPEKSPYWAGVDDGLHAATVHLGDQVSGPIVQLFSADAGYERAVYGPHSHASDNFRISIKGFQPVGPFRYDEGEFRFQEGWRGYSGDNVCLGQDGGWQLMVFSDKRGLRVRDVKPNTDPDWASYIEAMGTMMGIQRGDLFLDDRFDEPGPAGLVTSIAKAREGHSYVNSSFADAASWRDSGAGHRLACALMSNPVSGPVMALVATEPNRLVTSEVTIGTDVMTAVIDGSAQMGEESLVTGDIVVWPRGVPRDALRAGPEGLRELTIFGDRRGLNQISEALGDGSATEGSECGWLSALTETLLPELERVPVRP